MPFGGPNIKRLLSEVAGVGLGPREAESELIERLVKASHETFKVQARSHTAASLVRAISARIVPANCSNRAAISICSNLAEKYEHKSFFSSGTNRLPIRHTLAR